MLYFFWGYSYILGVHKENTLMRGLHGKREVVIICALTKANIDLGSIFGPT